MNSTANLISALRGPVLLITLGALLASHRMIDSSFWKLWPVLLIVLGVMKLLEMLARRGETTAVQTTNDGSSGGLA
jgi:hypothetical protein